jgi:membrane associated rhomboid family serine protease
MGLADRHYMRDDYRPSRVTIKLIVVLIVAFLIQCVLTVYGSTNARLMLYDLSLSLEGLRAGKVWQLLTFQFLHAAPWPWHVLVNCFVLYGFGRSVEETLGAKKFLALYFLAGIIGGLLYVGLSLLPLHAGGHVVGASAGICGIVAIYCSLHPMRELTVFLYFIPITIRAKYLLIALTIYSVFSIIFPYDGVAHAAHLGGIVVGIVYVRWREVWERWFQRWGRSSTRQREEELVRASRAQGRPWRQVVTETEPEDFMAKEVDPILDKISAHGIHSLTERERKILETARRKMRKH